MTWTSFQAHAYVVPILQGHFQSATFYIGDGDAADPEQGQPVEYALISRRSRDRAGLRYQRRGIDEVCSLFSYSVRIRGQLSICFGRVEFERSEFCGDRRRDARNRTSISPLMSIYAACGYEAEVRNAEIRIGQRV